MMTVQDILNEQDSLNKKCEEGHITISQRDVLITYIIDNNDNEGVRQCDQCSQIITEGCVWGDGETVECEPCKDKTTTQEEWTLECELGNAYWTQWEEWEK